MIGGKRLGRVLLMLAILASGAGGCLPDAVPYEQRRNITVDGVSLPVGIWAADWASGNLMANLLRLIVEEQLGFRSVISGAGGSSWMGALALASCLYPMRSFRDPSQLCGLPGGAHHVTLESWGSPSLLTVLAFVQTKWPKALPVNLDSVGYGGREGLYVLSPSLALARAAQGIPLEFYVSYNASWFDPSKYFAKKEDYSSSSFLPCSKLSAYNTSLLADYATFTGDSDGVLQFPNGLFAPNCPDGYWWLSPACRADPNSCVPIITGGPGWYYAPTLQLVTFNNMAVRVAVAASASLYAQLPRIGEGSLLYSFFPDATFVDLQPTALIFKEKNVNEWDTGLYRTGGSDTKLLKLTSASLQSAAPLVAGTVQGMSVTREQITDLLLRQKSSGNSSAETACQWLIDNRAVWSKWIPRPTKCSPGWGLVDSKGRFVQFESNASSCTRCPQGRFSDASLGTAICSLCPGGTFSDAFSSTACAACGPGTVAPLSATAAEGNFKCKRCDYGQFQPNSSQEMCVACSSILAGSTPLTLGAVSPSECVCPAGTYMLQQPSAPVTCVPCGDGLSCPGGPEPPVQRAAFFARSFELNAQRILVSAPQMVQCANSFKCPEHLALGQCPPLHENLACNDCIPGYRFDGRSCVKCSPAKGLLLAAFFFVTVIVAVLHYLKLATATQLYSEDTANLEMCVRFLPHALQTIAAFSSFPADASAEPMRLLSMVATTVTGLAGPGCLLEIADPVSHYVALIFALPAWVAIIVVEVSLVHLLRRRKLMSLQNLGYTVGMQFFPFTLASTLVSLHPWQCSVNPDGTSTLIFARSVTCWQSQEHLIMLCLSVFGMLAFMVLPLAIVFYATILFHRRVAKQEGIAFLQRYASVFGLVRQECYFWPLILLLRNTALPIIPLVLSSSPGVASCVMACVLALSLGLECRLWPWRSPLMNLVDALTDGVILGVVFGLVAQLPRSPGFGIGLYIWSVLGITGLVVLCLGVWLLYKSLRTSKTYGIFLSHHKEGAGVLARWLKLELSGYISKDIFLDSDDLNRLDTLFDTVARSTQCVVLILTKETLSRIWCAGEIAVAVHHGLDIIPVICDEASLPTPEFISNVGRLWSDADKMMLASLGVRSSMIRKAFKKLYTFPAIEFKRTSSLSAYVDMAESVAARYGKARHRPASRPKQQGGSGETHIYIVGDTSNPEAIALLGVVQKMLQATMQADVRVLEDGAFPPEARALVVLLTKAAFQNSELVRVILDAGRAECQRLPVIGDADFQFPDGEFWAEMSAQRGQAPQMWSSASPDDDVRTLQSLFDVIAIRLSPKGSFKLLQMEILALAQRLKGEAQMSKKISNRQATLGFSSEVSEESSLPVRTEDQLDMETATDEVPDEIKQSGPAQHFEV